MGCPNPDGVPESNPCDSYTTYIRTTFFYGEGRAFKKITTQSVNDIYQIKGFMLEW